ncbi:hypothetical protein Bsp3421_001036 [Burkholderia sp. FERM BP-3421]|uniref:hypothetical protein n=1 Tax=Burkholderia sp. FERM BP-3421 TaxID=1494466 RepID=UPI00235DE9B2|nr:hypothetical protein [Burkholderia sp. FERM BP-3421]WDD91141.1 hypothetical protein Bsp3421_001036 [Burkholderia sp. FERM BP-3421]
MRNTMIALTLLAASTPCLADGVRIPEGFVDGNAYQKFSALEKQRYLDGVVDGFYFGPVFAYQNLSRVVKLKECVTNLHLTDTQLVKLADQYLAGHPQALGMPMHGSVFVTLRDACAKGGAAID